MDEGIISVGFEEKVEEIVDRLQNPSSNIDIVSIVGMGGVGKTTLAKKVYNHRWVELHFHARAWCIVSAEFRTRDLLISILKDISSMDLSKMDEYELGGVLFKSLKGKRYFIVLDDIWVNDVWHQLRTFFPDDNNGSRILLTTRSRDVAMVANPSSNPYYLRPEPEPAPEPEAASTSTEQE